MQELLNKKIKELKSDIKNQKDSLNETKDRAKIYGEETYYDYFVDHYKELYAMQYALDILMDIQEEMEE